MIRLLKALSEAFRKFGAPRPSTPQARRLTLRVESLDQRLVPSTVAPKAVIPPATPALIASSPVPTESTGGQPVAEPDKPVHGYKWRRPRWPYQIETAGSAQEKLVVVVAAQTYQPPPAQVSHLAVGGADGILVLTAGGRILPHPPEGPLPTEVSFTIR